MTDTIIIGAGLSGLTIAHILKRRCYGHTFLLLEKGQTTGGAIRTHCREGFLAEAGPHGFLDNCGESVEILSETGLDSECIKAPLGRFVRYVYLRGKLEQIPQTPPAVLGTSLIGWKDKCRILGDLWKKPLEGEPTMARWVAYRFGTALLPFIDAALTGTYAGDMDRLAADGVMPGIRTLEKKHGSVIRGLLARKGKGYGPKRPSLPAMTSFPKGMQTLPDRLAAFLQPGIEFITDCGVSSIRKTENGWEVMSEKGVFKALNLVVALPINPSLALLREIDTSMPATRIPEGKIATVALGFTKEASLPPGFGYLIPDSENRFTLGTLFSSNMFPGRAPGDCCLIEVLVGGRRHPERLECDDRSLIDHALQDSREILHITQPPIYSKILRHNNGIPQPEQGYPELLDWRNRLTEKHKGLFVCGFGWDGIGINDMIKAAVRLAEAVMSERGHLANEPAIEKVYF